MKKVFSISGGAGRVLCSIPALLKHHQNEGDNFYIFAESGLEFFVGIKELQDLAFTPETKGIFENYIKPNIMVTPEPYRNRGYYNQEKNLIEAFDAEINNSEDHSDLEKIKIVLNKDEEINAVDAMNNAKAQQGKEKTIVIQPFGRSAQPKQAEIIDNMSRSLSLNTYINIVNALQKKYNVIYMGEFLEVEDKTFKIQTNLRQWAAIIEAADYFVGCDSVGQHMAHAFDKPGTVILGSTFAENITYPDHFQIIQKTPVDIRYFPIRLLEHGIDGDIANRYNDTCMDFTKEEEQDIIDKILKDIEVKVK
ncbi:hypothetical protein OAA64_01375 [bacterium]|nr:hypothetical protein [bacterium]